MTSLADSSKEPVDASRSRFGQDHQTRESARHVRGQGHFVDDLQTPGMLHVAVIGSPIAHGLIRNVDASEALRAHGVVDVLTGQTLSDHATAVFTLADLHSPPLPVAMHALALDRVRFLGEPVAAIAARTRAQAEDACRLVRLDLKPLAPILDPHQALQPDAELLHPALGSNVVIKRDLAFGPVQQLFDDASQVVSRSVTWGRHTSNALDTFGVVASWDAGSEELTVASNHQSYSMLGSLEHTLSLPDGSVRGVACDVGGAFGGKFWQPRPTVIACTFALRTGRPVKFVEDRRYHLTAGDNHGEDRTYDVDIALDSLGKPRAVRLRIVEDYGAYFLLGAAGNSSPLAQAVGAYDLEAVGVDFTGVLTNKTNQAAYRGFGAAAMNFAIERAMDAVAEESGVTRVDVRRASLLTPDRFPYRTPIGNMYDSGDYPTALDTALREGRWDHWLGEQSRQRGSRYELGLGLVTAQERSVPSLTELWLMFDQQSGRPTTAAETVTCRIAADGSVRISLHSPSLGTAVETVAATVASLELGVSNHKIRVHRLDSTQAGPAMGPAGSRMTAMVSGAMAGASAIILTKMREIAAHEIECDVTDIEFRQSDMTFHPRGVPGAEVEFSEICRLANTQSLRLPPGMTSGLEATYTYDHPMATMPNPDGGDWGSFNPVVGHSVHIPVVEVDTFTGNVEFRDYTVVHDCGTVMNPQGVRGQILGGICQGIGSALYEQLTYDFDGSLKQDDLTSYTMPTFVEMPEVRIVHQVTPSPYTYRGMKGVGEGGRIAAPAAVASAVENALDPWGVNVNALPITPDIILQWVQSG